MKIRIPPRHPIRASEITPETIYRARRRFLAESAGAVGALAGLALAGCGRDAAAQTRGPAAASAADATSGKAAALAVDALTPASYGTDISRLAPLAFGRRKTAMAGGEKVTPEASVAHYNNYYEFGTGKSDPADYAGTLRPLPWTIRVEGECEKPGTVSFEDFVRPNAIEERVYRHRCVEAWSIVVPWVGFPLGSALQRFKPTSKAKFVAFHTLYDPRQMPVAGNILPWPYREGLRIDEATHPLAFVAVGMYGKVLPNQDGAPLRLVIPWKYGFKSIKSIVLVRFVESMPHTTWNDYAPDWYGFYANVNPGVDTTQWSQSSERRLGEFFRRKTRMFNGYDEVAPLYKGMDLSKYY